MNPTSAQSATFSDPTASGKSLILRVVTGDNVPSFKNRKRAVLDQKTSKMRTVTAKQTKQRMTQLENRITSVLYSLCQTPEHGTDLECQKRLRTVLSGLSDDSLKEVPSFSFGTIYVEAGCEGVIIEITEI